MDRSMVLICISILVGSCAGQQSLLGGVVRVAAKLLEPIINENNGQDGYRFRYATEEQVREERGSFENGVWTVRGVVEWLSPDHMTKHTETYVADDKGYQTMPEDVPLGRAGLSSGALASLAG